MRHGTAKHGHRTRNALPPSLLGRPPRAIAVTRDLTAALSDAFAKSMAVFTAELMSQLKHRHIDLCVDSTDAADAAASAAQLTEAPAWVRRGHEKARQTLKQASRYPSDEPAMRAQLIRGRILMAMRARGVTQAALAHRLHKSPAVLSRMLKSPERCRLPTLERIAKELHLDLSDLLAVGE